MHLFLGYFLGSAAERALHAATGPALAVLAAVVLAAVGFWLVRRGKRAGAGALTEAACPACLALALVAEQPEELRLMLSDEAGPAAPGSVAAQLRNPFQR